MVMTPQQTTANTTADPLVSPEPEPASQPASSITTQANPLLLEDAALALPKETMRALGYKVIDTLVERMAHLGEQPFPERRSLNTDLLNQPIPQRAQSPDAVMDIALNEVLRHINPVDHPRFMAYVPSPGNFISTMADTLASGFNVFAGSSMAAAGPAHIERQTIGWLCQQFGLSASAGGLFVSGGTIANFTGLAVARHIMLSDNIENAVVYFSDQTHSSNIRALKLLGFQPKQLRKLPSDTQLKLSPSTLRQAIESDRQAGLKPFCVIANAGTTNTGTIDPLNAIADCCDAYDLWFHVDGAFGGGAIVSERAKAQMAGIERVDSMAMDPHKWMFQPIEIGCVLVRNEHWLKRTFEMRAEYLQDAVKSEEFNHFDYGPQLTRGCRALKLWMSLQVFGEAAFRQGVDKGLAMAEYVERALRRYNNSHTALKDGILPAGKWEIVHPANMSVINFRWIKPGATPDELNTLNEALNHALVKTQVAYTSTTILKGKTVIRMCTLNPRLTTQDMDEILATLFELAEAC